MSKFRTEGTFTGRMKPDLLFQDYEKEPKKPKKFVVSQKRR